MDLQDHGRQKQGLPLPRIETGGLLIGLTGTYCSGKNHIAAMLCGRGFPVLDIDKLGYVCLENSKKEIFAKFGGDLENQDGSLNRKALGARVFGNRERLAALEAIVHPQANLMTEQWIAGQKGRTCVLNAALLHKTSVFGRLNCIILVRAPRLVRLMRAKRRDSLPWKEIFRRFASQKKFMSQYLCGNADIYRVENPGNGMRGTSGGFKARQKLERRIDEILAALNRK